MRIRKDHKPFEYVLPTETSLDLAGQIAELTGVPFDRDAVNAQGQNLHQIMFSDLCMVLDLSPDEFEFHAGLYYATRVFSGRRSDGSETINLDLTLEFWLSAMTLIATIATFEVTTDEDWSALLQETDRLMTLFVDADQFYQIRDGLKPHLATYAHLLNVSHAMARAMLVFCFCHEIAHHQLEHLDMEAGKDQELEADRHAARMFLKIVESGEKAHDTTVFIDRKVACAPLALTSLLGILEVWLERQGNDAAASQSKHPRARERYEVLAPIIVPQLDDTGDNLHQGMIAGIADIKKCLATSYSG